MTTVDLIVRPDGTIRCVYSDALNLRNIGRLTMERASNVEWDEGTQMWVATTVENEILATSHSREEVIKQEVSILSERLAQID